MRTIKILLIILILGLFSCNRVENVKKPKEDKTIIVVEHMPDHIPNFKFIRKDDSLNASIIISEEISTNLMTQEINFLDSGTDFLTNCDCALDSGEIQIKISNNGGWMYRELNLFISDTIRVNHYFANDIRSSTHIPHYFRVEISNLEPKLSEIIYGKVLSIFDTTYIGVTMLGDTSKIDQKITEKYLGYFRCKLK